MWETQHLFDLYGLLGFLFLFFLMSLVLDLDYDIQPFKDFTLSYTNWEIITQIMLRV